MTIRYSVIVPTYRRPDTLRVTLRCLAEVRHPRLEVIVMDNAGGPETAAVLAEAAAAQPLKAIRSDTPLPMSDSWEAGLAAATGDYVTILGDDDALALNAIDAADQILGTTRADILGWSPCAYYWPTATNPYLRNIFHASVGMGCTVAHPSFFLNAYMSDPWVYHAMPGIYQAFVARGVIEETRRRFGRYFLDRLPDLSSAVTNAVHIAQTQGRIAWTQLPLSIWGMSHNSFGQGYLNHRGGQARRDAFQADEGGLVDPMFPDCPMLEVVMASFHLRIVARLRDAGGFGDLPDRAAFATRTAQAMTAAVAREPHAYDAIVADIHAILDRYGQDRAAVAIPPRPQATAGATRIDLNAAENLVTIRARLDHLGIVDTHGAMRFFRSIAPSFA